MSKFCANIFLIQTKNNFTLISSRPTGLLTLGERYEGYFGKVVDSFEENTGSKYELYNPKEMAVRFPMIDMGPKIWGCYDPSAGILMADKCLKLLWVRIKLQYIKLNVA